MDLSELNTSLPPSNFATRQVTRTHSKVRTLAHSAFRGQHPLLKPSQQISMQNVQLQQKRRGVRKTEATEPQMHRLRPTDAG